MELQAIKTSTTWNDAADCINSNNQKIGNEISKLKAATYKNKGYFASAEALANAYPTGSAGSKAYVGTSYPYAIYSWDASVLSWVDSGEVGGEEEVNLEDYYTKDETKEAIDRYHIILSEEAYEALETKEEKLYFTYEE